MFAGLGREGRALMHFRAQDQEGTGQGQKIMGHGQKIICQGQQIVGQGRKGFGQNSDLGAKRLTRLAITRP